MKSHFFHLMPYKHLPEDFAQRHRSVWVDVPASLYDPIKGHANYNEYLDGSNTLTRPASTACA
jgi:L-rhamnose mutarotase